jgi:hypothetical protein
MQEFYINKDATLPLLKMELINDGRYDYNKFHEMIQNSSISFTMTNNETGVIKVANNTSGISLQLKDGCSEEYYICYKWDPKDTRTKGKFNGKFTIIFGDVFGGGKLIVPIQEELVIYVL